jgi:hypothetical protein
MIMNKLSLGVCTFSYNLPQYLKLGDLDFLRWKHTYSLYTMILFVLDNLEFYLKGSCLAPAVYSASNEPILAVKAQIRKTCRNCFPITITSKRC